VANGDIRIITSGSGIIFPDNTKITSKNDLIGSGSGLGGGGADIYNTNAGKVGIGTMTPIAPLSFNDLIGDRISLWGQTAGPHYGFGIQSNLLQIHGYDQNSNIAFGYGSSSSFTEKMRITGGGNVGIGTTAPAATLHVRGVNGSGNEGLVVDSRNSDPSGYNALNIYPYIVGNGDYNPITQNGDHLILFYNGKADNGGGLVLAPWVTSSIPRGLRIDAASGNVGIGTPNPSTPLEVSAALSTLNTTDPGFLGGGAIGWSYSPQPTMYYAKAFLHVMGVKDDAGGGGMTYLGFRVSGFGSPSLPPTSLVLTGAGNVGIGTISPQGPLNVGVGGNDSILFYKPGGVDNTIGIQTLLDNKPLSSYATYGGAENRLILQPLVGNVGIGTTTPYDRLDVSADGTGSNGIRWSYYNEPTQYFARSFLHVVGDTTIPRGNHTYLGFQVTSYPNHSTDPAMVITGAGNVGIGYTEPSVKLDVAGAAYFRGYVQGIDKVSGDRGLTAGPGACIFKEKTVVNVSVVVGGEVMDLYSANDQMDTGLPRPITVLSMSATQLSSGNVIQLGNGALYYNSFMHRVYSNVTGTISAIVIYI
jgi:hypothetical protein